LSIIVFSFLYLAGRMDGDILIRRVHPVELFTYPLAQLFDVLSHPLCTVEAFVVTKAVEMATV
jgi:hypothetical protein